MRIRVDNAKCTGHGQCYAVGPELFPIDDEGYSILQPHNVEPADEDTALQGVHACPEAALILENGERGPR